MVTHRLGEALFDLGHPRELFEGLWFHRAAVGGADEAGGALDQASVKVSAGPPGDEDEDLDLQVWAGEVPLRTVRLDPVPAPDLADDIVLPDHIATGPMGPGTVPVRDVS